MPNLLEVRDLVKHFPLENGSLLHAVDGVDLSLRRGEILGLVGESGCGKSTVGRMLVRLIEPTSGSILFDGEDMLGLSRGKLFELRRRMQIVFQDPFSSLDPRKSVLQIVSEPLRIHGYGSRAQVREKVSELLLAVGLSDASAHLYQHEMDGGRCQRVGIARALALDPQFIVCDEPVSALDVSVQAQILNLLQELRRKLDLSYVFISHNLAVVQHMCSRIMVMYLGKVLEVADRDDIFERPLHPYTMALLSAVPSMTVDERPERILLSGDVPTPIDPPPGCRFLKRCVYAASACAETTPWLEDIGEGRAIACLRWREIAETSGLEEVSL